MHNKSNKYQRSGLVQHYPVLGTQSFANSVQYMSMYDWRIGTCLVRTLKGTQNQYLLPDVRTYYQDWFVYIHEVYTGTECGVLSIQEYVLNQVLTYVLSNFYCIEQP